MVRISTGETYTAKRARSGSSSRGPWELIVIENGNDELTLWVTNTPSGVTDGGQFRIKSIDNMTKKKVAYKDGKVCKDRSEKNVEWQTEVDCNVTVEKVGFSEAPFDMDDLPFDIGDNPFEDELPL